MHWQPNASIETLRQRAVIVQKVRQFFLERSVLEVETPLLMKGAICNPYIESFALDGKYLQTSPEFAMKRLLAAGSGSIYQICKAFRKEEIGRLHKTEFTMLEWYRVGYDHHALMQEVAELFTLLLKTGPCEMLSYQILFETHLQINPHTASIKHLEMLAKSHHLDLALDNKDDWLNLLLTHLIEPKLGSKVPCFVYDYPATQSALAKLSNDTPPVAERFEVYYKGIELGNGFHELNNATEQRKRFENQLKTRKANQQPLLEIDDLFLESLNHLPNCAGVAIGLDRLILLALNKTHLNDVMSF